MSELLRVDLTKAEVHRLRVLAAEAGEDRAKFYRRALETSPRTRKAFQTKETQK
jgi:hypothetical protein